VGPAPARVGPRGPAKGSGETLPAPQSHGPAVPDAVGRAEAAKSRPASDTL